MLLSVVVTFVVGLVEEGADNLSNPSAIISKNRFLDVKFLMRRCNVASKGLVRNGVLEHRTIGQKGPVYLNTINRLRTIQPIAGQKQVLAILIDQ